MIYGFGKACLSDLVQIPSPVKENLPILVAALPKCTSWSEDISNALLEVIIFFLWAIDYHYV